MIKREYCAYLMGIAAFKTELGSQTNVKPE
jgi:hypothetical protein